MFEQKPTQQPTTAQPASSYELPAFLSQRLSHATHAPAQKKPRPEKERLFKQMTRRGARPGR